MKLNLLDWLVIGAYFLFNLGIGIYYARRARGSTTEFFLSGRDVPWWLAGTSMVATTFAADTPLAVTGFVAQNGIAVAIPRGYAGFVMVRSGLAARHGIACVNAPGLIDAGYRGEIVVILLNTDRREPFVIRRGDRIAQLVLQKVIEATVVTVDELDETARGEGGFGSTGRA